MTRRALALVALLVVCAGCGGDDDVDVVGSGDPTTTLAPDTPVSSPPIDPSAPVEPGSAEPIEPVGNAVNVHPIAIDGESGYLGTATGVSVRFYGGVAPCFVLDRYDVEETPETVTITLYGGADPDAGDTACIELAKLYSVDVPLYAPLGERALVDGSLAL